MLMCIAAVPFPGQARLQQQQQEQHVRIHAQQAQPGKYMNLLLSCSCCWLLVCIECQFNVCKTVCSHVHSQCLLMCIAAVPFAVTLGCSLSSTARQALESEDTMHVFLSAMLADHQLLLLVCLSCFETCSASSSCMQQLLMFTCWCRLGWSWFRLRTVYSYPTIQFQW